MPVFKKHPTALVGYQSINQEFLKCPKIYCKVHEQKSVSYDSCVTQARVRSTG